MSQLIPYETRHIGTETVETVNGRDIYAFLGLSRDYSDWVKRQIKSGQLIENRDFIIFYTHVENAKAGRPSPEYHFTFRAAEHIGMMSRTAKGREVREYFLDLEDAAKHANPHAILDRHPDMKAITEMAVSIAEAREIAMAAQAKAHQAETKAAVADAKADMALSEVRRMTVEHFIMSNGLLHQFPPSEHRRISDWLQEFCFAYGLDVRKDAVYGKPWPEEKAFPLHAFSAWLRHAQTGQKQHHLRAVKSEEIEPA